MYYYKARIYSPTLGRFLQTDPIGYEDQYNLYAYVGNDPINGVDPTGQYECSTEEACEIAEETAQGLEKAERYYRETKIGSRLQRDRGRANSVADIRETLGVEGDGGVEITTGEIADPETPAEYLNGTITVDTGNLAAARENGYSTTVIVAHELGHHRRRNMKDKWTVHQNELLPVRWEHLLRRIPGAFGYTNFSERDYVKRRLRNYCRRLGRYTSDCNASADQESQRVPNQ